MRHGPLLSNRGFVYLFDILYHKLKLLEKINWETPAKYWLLMVVSFSILPIIFRLAIAHEIDLLDILWCGIALNIANFAFIDKRNFEGKNILMLVSVFLMTVICGLIGAIVEDPDRNIERNFFINHRNIILVCLSYILMGSSVFLSYAVNYYATKKKTQ